MAKTSRTKLPIKSTGISISKAQAAQICLWAVEPSHKMSKRWFPHLGQRRRVFSQGLCVTVFPSCIVGRLNRPMVRVRAYEPFARDSHARFVDGGGTTGMVHLRHYRHKRTVRILADKGHTADYGTHGREANAGGIREDEPGRCCLAEKGGSPPVAGCTCDPI